MSALDSRVRMRSIYASSMHDADAPQDTEAQSGVFINDSDLQPAITSSPPNNNSIDSEGKGYVDELVKLPESTHTLLFTQPVCSIPFLISVGVAVLSYVCLWLSNIGVLGRDQSIHFEDIPVNVTWEVRMAQYVSIFIVLLMEEEIPTGLYLLRRIPRAAFEQEFPRQKYSRFIFSSVMRIVLGYLFLYNATIVLIQATEVIEIFYDVLALQFVQQLDDIAFVLAKKDVLGVSMRKACTSKCFQTEFDKNQFKRNKKMSIFLKAVYFINLGCILAAMSIVTTKQVKGDYQCSSITVDFGSEIWENALVNMPKAHYDKWVWMYPFWRDKVTPDRYEEWKLLYSFFDGVYERDSNVMHAGRPVYKERRKFDGTAFELRVPAEIKYCEGISAWVFTHEHIHKFKETDESDCNWLLRSEETTEFDLLNVATKWKVWLGVIGQTELSYTCNGCNDDIDCNLNGKCVNSQCNCYNRTGVEYLGTHCEVKFKESCQTIIEERYNAVFEAAYYPSNGNWNDGPYDKLSQVYSRPVYELYVPDTGWFYRFLYTGKRWFGSQFLLENFDNQNQTAEEADNIYKAQIYDSHAFWGRFFEPILTQYVSDETTKDTPVGVDFYSISDRGDQFGPFGALSPLQLYNQTGRGYFRCGGPRSSPGNSSSPERMLQSKKLQLLKP